MLYSKKYRAREFLIYAERVAKKKDFKPICKENYCGIVWDIVEEEYYLYAHEYEKRRRNGTDGNHWIVATYRFPLDIIAGFEQYDRYFDIQLGG